MRLFDFLPNSSSSEFDVSSVSSSDADAERAAFSSHEVEALPLDPNFQYGVWISYVEVYNERIFDLLDEKTLENGQKEMLKLKEDKSGRVFVKGLKEEFVSSSQEGQAVLQRGYRNRQVK